jgi:quercetin dioxygenase-like cupin family protein
VASDLSRYLSCDMFVIQVSLYDWGKISEEKITNELSRKIISGKNIMLGHLHLKSGCVIASHSHDSEQMTYVLRGSMTFHFSDRDIVVKEGQVLHIPSRVEHGAKALEDTLEVDIFSPIRLDWLTGKDDYLRK